LSSASRDGSLGAQHGGNNIMLNMIWKFLVCASKNTHHQHTDHACADNWVRTDCA
jgi:hypothetical protein